MAGRLPGVLGEFQTAGVIDSGTSCLIDSPAPGALGATLDVSGWSTERKLLEAAERATPKLPASLQSEFAALFTPQAVAFTGAVLIAWAASHAVGIGQIADIVLILTGLVTIGWQAVDAARDIGRFVESAIDAKSVDDLERAAEHLARAVVVIGVSAFVALVMKYGKRLGRTAPAVQSEFWGVSVAEWLARLGIPKAPPLVVNRLEVALKFFRQRLGGKSAADITAYVKGIDLSQEVRITVLKKGTEVIGYNDPSRLGLYYTKVGTPLQHLGIDPGTRQFLRFRLKTDVTVLESRASGITDTFTRGRTENLPATASSRAAKLGAGAGAAPVKPGAEAKSLVSGGGVQYVMPDASSVLERVN